MAKKTKKPLQDICFPVPQNFALTTTTPAAILTNEKVKKGIFQQTIQTAYQIKVPYEFTSTYNSEKPYSLISEYQIEMVSSLFQALQPQDAIEVALAQQFIIVHLQAIRDMANGTNERDIKKLELTHSILETLQKYRTKGAQLINVQYNVNQGQVFNSSKVNIKTGHSEDEPITIEGETR